MPAKRDEPFEPYPTLIAWREFRGLTQEQVGNKLGVGSQAVHKWEAGKVPLSVPRLRQLAEIYGTTADALLFYPAEQDQAERLRRANAILDQLSSQQAENWLAFAEGMIAPKEAS